jgi:hypothetical protein
MGTAEFQVRPPLGQRKTNILAEFRSTSGGAGAWPKSVHCCAGAGIDTVEMGPFAPVNRKAFKDMSREREPWVVGRLNASGGQLQPCSGWACSTFWWKII